MAHGVLYTAITAKAKTVQSKNHTAYPYHNANVCC